MEIKTTIADDLNMSQQLLATLIQIEEEATKLPGLIKFYTPKDVAEMMKMSLPSVYDLFKRRDFPKCNYGAAMVVERSAFLNYVQKPILRGDENDTN